jgi:predicted glycosyltransferase
VLLYCQHAIGLGHLMRSLSLAGALAGRFNVALLSGGVVPLHITPPPGVELVKLPPLMLADGGGLRSPDPARTVEQAKAIRARMLADAVRTRRPAVVVVELFPFGRRAFANEILAMLERSRALPEGPPLIASSVRDILVGRGSEQAAYDERVCRLANANFDLILVHCDPRFATLEESFDPATELRVPVRYTGFVSAPRPAAAAPRRAAPTVIVSAGGGRVGEPLLQAAIEAYPRLRRQRGVEMRVIAGPFLPDDAWRRLRASAEGVDGLVVLREVENLGAELAGGAVSVSQCGYNTALDVLKSGIPALVVPYLAPGEDEQLRRAQRLAALGAVRLLDPRVLDGDELARDVASLLGTVPRGVELDLDGADASAELLWQALERPRLQPEAAIA